MMGRYTKTINSLTSSKTSINQALSEKLSDTVDVKFSEMADKIRGIETSKNATINFTNLSKLKIAINCLFIYKLNDNGGIYINHYLIYNKDSISFELETGSTYLFIATYCTDPNNSKYKNDMFEVLQGDYSSRAFQEDINEKKVYNFTDLNFTMEWDKK